MARWVDHDGNERTKAFDRKAEAQNHIGVVTTALTTGRYADPKRASVWHRREREQGDFTPLSAATCAVVRVTTGMSCPTALTRVCTTLTSRNTLM
jgi:hypothetical protein